MRTKSIVIWTTAVIFAVGMIFIYSSSFAEKQRVASLANLKGTVKIRAAGQQEWAPAAVRMELREGDELRSEAGSTAIIRMEDGSMMKMGPLAQMTISKLGKKGAGAQTSLDMSVGKTWSRVNKLSDESDFSIKTPTAVAGVRGTFFSSEVEQTSQSTFDVFEGAVAVSSAANPDAAVMVSENQRTTVSPDQDPSAPANIPADQLESGRGGFSSEEFTAATYDLQISVTPQVVEPGQSAALNVQLFKNGSPFQKEVKVNLTLSGSATFVSTGTNTIEATTDSQGALSLEITSNEKETVTVSAQLTIKVRK